MAQTFVSNNKDMDAFSFYEWVMLVATAGGFVIAAIALNHKFKKEEAADKKQTLKEYEAHESRMKKMEGDIAKVLKETEELRTERQKIVSQIYDDIRELKSKHDRDIDVMHAEIKELVGEIKDKNEKDHNELKSILKVINDQLITVCTQFADHKEETTTAKPRRK